MQNIDYYSNTTQSHSSPLQYSPHDPEYFSRMANFQQNESAKRQKKANRLMTFITALCIISFTIGLVVGIKFAGGEKKEIVDSQTKEALSNAGATISNMISESTSTRLEASPAVKSELTEINQNINASQLKEAADIKDAVNPESAESTQAKFLYPKNDYPFVIRIGDKYTARQSKDIANYLSKKGHTIIISKSEEMYRIYSGPFKTGDDAKLSLQKINNYTDNLWFKSAVIIKRQQ